MNTHPRGLHRGHVEDDLYFADSAREPPDRSSVTFLSRLAPHTFLRKKTQWWANHFPPFLGAQVFPTINSVPLINRRPQTIPLCVNRTQTLVSCVKPLLHVDFSDFVMHLIMKIMKRAWEENEKVTKKIPWNVKIQSVEMNMCLTVRMDQLLVIQEYALKMSVRLLTL